MVSIMFSLGAMARDHRNNSVMEIRRGCLTNKDTSKRTGFFLTFYRRGKTMSRRREKFIIYQTSIMLTALLLLSLVDVLTFEYWYFVSYAGFVFLAYTTDKLSRLNPGRKGIRLLLVVGGVGFIAIGIRTLLPIIKQVL